MDHPNSSPGAPGSPPPDSTGKLPEGRYAVVGLLLLGVAAFVPLVALFFSPLVLAATFAAFFSPVYRWWYGLLRRNGPAASAVTCLLLVLCVLIPLAILLHLVVDQAIYLYKSAAPTVAQILHEGRNNRFIAHLLQTPISQWLESHVKWGPLLSDVKDSALALGKEVLNRTYAGIYGLMATLAITLFVLFYFFIDGLRIAHVFGYLLPIQRKYKEQIFSGFQGTSRATVKGILLIGVIQGTLGALTLLVFGIKSWLLWGFVCIVVSIIPLAGAHIVLIPTGIIQIILGHTWQGIAIILIDVGVIGIIDNVLRPRLVGRGAKMHDLIVFFSTIGGLTLFGIPGVIIGPAIASFFLNAVDIYKEEFKERLDRFESG